TTAPAWQAERAHDAGGRVNAAATRPPVRWPELPEARHEPVPQPAGLDPAGDHRRAGLAPARAGPRLRARPLPRMGLHHQPALGRGGDRGRAVRAVAAVEPGRAAPARAAAASRAPVARAPGRRPGGPAPGPL